MSWLTMEKRHWIYGVLTALIPLLAYLGVDKVTLELGLMVAAAMLGTGGAFVYSGPKYGKHAAE